MIANEQQPFLPLEKLINDDLAYKSNASVHSDKQP